jgi:hypothetical protein
MQHLEIGRPFRFGELAVRGRQSTA